jgi:hypothetical protein
VPRGPTGEERPAHVIGAGITAPTRVGDIEEKLTHPSSEVRSGQAGAKARANNVTPEKHQEIARRAAAARWS